MAVKYDGLTWTMPEVYPGDVVLVRRNLDERKRHPAIVTAVGDKAISLAVIHEDWGNLDHRDGCRHEDDPDLLDPQLRHGATFESVIWVEHPNTLKLRELEAIVQNMRAYVTVPKAKKSKVEEEVPAV